MLALGFVHLMIPAVLELTNSCLFDPNLDPNVYGAYAGVFAIVAICLLVIFQHAALSFGSYIDDRIQHNTPPPMTYIPPPVTSIPSTRNETDEPAIQQSTLEMKDILVVAQTYGTTSEPKIAPIYDTETSHSHSHSHSHGQFLEVGLVRDEEGADEVTLSKWIMIAGLELGTALHSVSIGLALGVAYQEFVPLFIAITFHQMFEGMAIGTRLADPDVKLKRNLAIILVLLYSFTTPLGIAIGIGFHHTYNPQSTSALVSAGIIDSLAAGFVIYNSLFLLHDTFLTTCFVKKRLEWRFTCFCSFCCGVAFMAFIGKYA